MNLKSKLSALISRFCVAMLALLGYSCGSSSVYPDIMYGTPTGSFEIKGTVTNEKGEPLRDALIRVADPNVDSGIWSIERSVTNDGGNYDINGSWSASDKLKIVCIPPGNAYKTDSITVPVKYVYDKDHKKDTWYIGHASLTVDFKLKPEAGE